MKSLLKKTVDFFSKKRKEIFLIVAGIIFVVAIGLSYYTGYKLGFSNPQTILVKGVSSETVDSKDAPEDIDFSVFWQVWQKIKDEHIKGDKIADQDMLYGAMKGLVDSLGDPNTMFFKPDDSKKFEEDVEGSFGGVGMELGMKGEDIVVIAPLEDSPAAKAGILAGDKILEVDKKSIYGIDVYEAVKKIRGDIGTSVEITIIRNGEQKPREFNIVRERIEAPTLKMEMKDGDIAHLQLFSFNENAPFLFYKSALTLAVGNTKGLVLDLRNNPGGFLEVAVNLAGWFLDKGDLVVTEKFRSGKETPFYANGLAAFKDLPVVILMNKGSASASEILAGALRVKRNVKLIGENSFGKGTVQELQALKDGSKIKITIAQWLLPDGKVIDEKGIVPDIEVKLTEKDVAAKKDPQLDRAIEELNKIIESKKSVAG